MWLFINCSSERFGITMGLGTTVSERSFGINCGLHSSYLDSFLYPKYIMDKQELTVILPLFYFERLIFSSFEQS